MGTTTITLSPGWMISTATVTIWGDPFSEDEEIQDVSIDRFEFAVIARPRSARGDIHLDAARSDGRRQGGDDHQLGEEVGPRTTCVSSAPSAGQGSRRWERVIVPS
jgi:hypothetical protein